MDNNKKIIVAIVGVIMTGVLVFAITSLTGNSISFSDKSMAEGLEFDTPEVDIQKFDNSSKKELYDDAQEFDEEKYDSIADNLSFLQKVKKKMVNEEVEDEIPEETEDVNEELQMLMALQNSLNADPQADMGYMPTQVMQNEPEPKKVPKEGAYFFGAASASAKSGKESLIPAEVIDQGVFKQGATIALRTKQTITIPQQNISIPKGAVIYGVVRIEDTRLNIRINKYRRDNALYSVDMNVYDYDGVQGIHLDHRSIFSIPSNVAKDVYRAAMQTYQQQQTIVGNGNNGDRRVPLDRVAILSAAKEVSKELFDKRKVFVPRKYHLWLTINNEDNDK